MLRRRSSFTPGTGLSSQGSEALRHRQRGQVPRVCVCVCRRPAHSGHLGSSPWSTALCPPHGPLGGGPASSCFSLEVSPAQGLCEHCSRELALVVGFVHNLPTQIRDLLQGREVPAPHPALKLSPGALPDCRGGVGSATPALAFPCRVTPATEAQTRVRDGWRWLLQPAPLCPHPYARTPMWPARPGFGRLGLRLSVWALSATAWDSSPANAVKAACGHCVKAGSGPRAESTGRARHRCWRVSPRWGDLWSPALGLGEATSLPEHPWFAGVAPLSLLWLLGRWRRPAQSSNGAGPARLLRGARRTAGAQ